MQRFAGQRVRVAREAAEKTREQLAVEVGRSYHTVVSVELDRATPSLELVHRLADSLGVAPGDFFADVVRTAAEAPPISDAAADMLRASGLGASKHREAA